MKRNLHQGPFKDPWESPNTTLALATLMENHTHCSLSTQASLTSPGQSNITCENDFLCHMFNIKHATPGDVNVNPQSDTHTLKAALNSVWQ